MALLLLALALMVGSGVIALVLPRRSPCILGAGGVVAGAVLGTIPALRVNTVGPAIDDVVDDIHRRGRQGEANERSHNTGNRGQHLFPRTDKMPAEDQCGEYECILDPVYRAQKPQQIHEPPFETVTIDTLQIIPDAPGVGDRQMEISQRPGYAQKCRWPPASLVLH